MSRGSVRVDISFDIPKEVRALLLKNEEYIAKMIEGEARASTAFRDKKGSLRGTIKAKMAKVQANDGMGTVIVDGWIVKAGSPKIAPHAHLVEFGPVEGEIHRPVTAEMLDFLNNNTGMSSSQAALRKLTQRRSRPA